MTFTRYFYFQIFMSDKIEFRSSWGLTPMSSTQGQLKISYQKDDITKVAKNLNASEKSLKKAHFNRASLRSPFSDIDFEQN